MRVRSLTAVLLSSVLALSVVGCAGDDPAEPSDSTVELPSTSSTESATDGTDGATLDLESMTDEELLAEAERAYQGFFDDVAELRDSGGTDYTTLDEWTEAEFRIAYDESMNELLPEGFTIQGAQKLLGMELASVNSEPEPAVLVNVCVSNEDVTIVGPDGENATSEERSIITGGEIEFWLSDDATHLVVRSERGVDDVEQSLCE